MILWMYSGLLFLFGPVVFVVFVWRYGLKRTVRGLRERWGFGGSWPSSGSLWVHAASVGEVRAAEGFLRALAVRYPNTPILVTTTTINGKELALRLGLASCVRLAPIDWPGAVRRVLSKVSPRAVVLIETELWPQWLRVLASEKVPVVVVNARLSDGAFPLYRRLRLFLSPLLASLRAVGAQSDLNARRYRDLGVPSDRIVVTGNIKNDVPLPDLNRRDDLRKVFRTGPGPVWVAGSTHRGEESVLALVYAHLRKEFPTLRLVVAPRHVERVSEVFNLFRLHFRVLRRSDLSSSGEWDVLVLDTVGELTEIYGLADVAFMGGSLVPRGGQNPLEPARWGVPVLWGPSMENFRDMVSLFESQGAVRLVSDEASLTNTLRFLLSSPKERETLGCLVRNLADRQRGALDASLHLLRGVF